MNQQPIEKQNLATLNFLEVHSIFHTIQGEGPFAGQPAVFIRLAGCNLQCPLCDTFYTKGREQLAIISIVSKVDRLVPMMKSPLVVITGGEPFRQSLNALVIELLTSGYRVQIETNGTLFQSLPFEDITIVCSPKTGTINRKLLPHVDAIKYVIHADDYCANDGLPNSALGHSAHPRLARPPKDFDKPIYLQPVDEGDEIKNQRHLNVAIDSVINHGYTLCLQIHKIIDME